MNFGPLTIHNNDIVRVLVALTVQTLQCIFIRRQYISIDIIVVQLLKLSIRFWRATD